MKRIILSGLAMTLLVAGTAAGTSAAAASARPTAPVGVGTPEATPTGASTGEAVTAPAGGRTKDPIASYTLVTSNGGGGTVVLNRDGTFGSTYGDDGFWILLNKTYALDVYSSTGSDKGCVYVGKVTTTGMNSARHQGPVNCNGTKLKWYAIKFTGAASTGSPASSNGAGVDASTEAKAVGRYHALFSSGVNGNLAINPDGSYGLTGGTVVTEGGNWASLGKTVAMTATTANADQGCLYVGTLSKKGINTTTWGPYQCMGYTGSWFATKA